MGLYRKLHFLSLDIVGGALASSVFMAKLWDAQPGHIWYLALGLTVWLLYTGDHVVDAWRHRKKGLREMHQFIFSYRRPILYAMAIFLIVDLFLIFSLLDKEVLKLSLILAVFVFLFYGMRHLFRRNRFFYIPGEVFVLLIYLAGVSLGPMVLRQEWVGTTHLMVVLMMAGILMMNMGIISLYDTRLDSRLGIASLAIVLGKVGCRFVVLISGLMILGLSFLQFMVSGNTTISYLGFILAGMALIMLLILYSPSYFRKNDGYRLMADAVLYLGFLSLLV